MVENEPMYQVFITPTSGLNFLMKFCRNDKLIIEIISDKIREKFHPLMPQSRAQWTNWMKDVMERSQVHYNLLNGIYVRGEKTIISSP